MIRFPRFLYVYFCNKFFHNFQTEAPNYLLYSYHLHLLPLIMDHYIKPLLFSLFSQICHVENYLFPLIFPLSSDFSPSSPILPLLQNFRLLLHLLIIIYPYFNPIITFFFTTRLLIYQIQLTFSIIFISVFDCLRKFLFVFKIHL